MKELPPAEQTCENCVHERSKGPEHCLFCGDPPSAFREDPWHLEARADAIIGELRGQITEDERSWCKLMVEIAELDPSWTDEMGKPEFNDPEFCETYDPWEGLRLIRGQLAALREALEPVASYLSERGQRRYDDPHAPHPELTAWARDAVFAALASGAGKPQADVIATSVRLLEAIQAEPRGTNSWLKRHRKADTAWMEAVERMREGG